jgi:hypothetical protein
MFRIIEWKETSQTAVVTGSRAMTWTTRHFRNKREKYLKDKINEIATNWETRTSEISVETEVNLESVVSLRRQLCRLWERRVMICLHIPTTF